MYNVPPTVVDTEHELAIRLDIYVLRIGERMEQNHKSTESTVGCASLRLMFLPRLKPVGDIGDAADDAPTPGDVADGGRYSVGDTTRCFSVGDDGDNGDAPFSHRCLRDATDGGRINVGDATFSHCCFREATEAGRSAGEASGDDSSPGAGDTMYSMCT